jgi:Flp pilus assembly protein TadD
LAVADYSRASALAPANFEVRSDRGVAYFQLGEYEKARLDFEFALGLKPNFPMALRGRGLSLLNLGERDRGLADLVAACYEFRFGCDFYQL